jgi:hypothetical protein
VAGTTRIKASSSRLLILSIIRWVQANSKGDVVFKIIANIGLAKK